MIGMPQLHIRVSSTLLERMTKAARAIDQPVTVWVRLAIREKLDRDED